MAAEFGTYALADLAAQVKGQDAIRIERASAPLSRDDELVRGWKVAHHLVERARVFLDLYGDGDQTLTEEHHAITAPAVADGIGQPGIWRVVRNFEDPQAPGMILQTLRRGWITTLVTAGAVDYSEARVPEVESGESIAGGGAKSYQRKLLRVVWTGVDPTKRESVAAELRAVTAWTPVIRGEAYGSGWKRLLVTHAAGEDGSGSVTVLLALGEVALDFYDGKGTAHERIDTVLHDVPADVAQGYVDGWRKYGAQSTAGTAPLGGSVDGSGEVAGGLVTLRFSAPSLTAAAKAAIVGAYQAADKWVAVFKAWNQPAANLPLLYVNPFALSSENLTALGATRTLNGWSGSDEAAKLAAALASCELGEFALSGLDYDEERNRFAWQATWRADDAIAGWHNRATFEERVQYRTVWDNAGNIWVKQHRRFQWRRAFKVFTNADAAWAYRDSGNREGPEPRKIGERHWLAVHIWATYSGPWVDDPTVPVVVGQPYASGDYDAAWGALPESPPLPAPSGGSGS